MRNALHQVCINQFHSTDHALGDLLRFLSTVEPNDDSKGGVPAGSFLTWFEDRFHVAKGACTSKAFGDAIAFGIRLGLIHFGKKSRTRKKLIHYTGTSLSRLDEALRQWKEMDALHADSGSIQPTELTPNNEIFRQAKSGSPEPSGGRKVLDPELRFPIRIAPWTNDPSDCTCIDDEDDEIDF